MTHKHPYSNWINQSWSCVWKAWERMADYVGFCSRCHESVKPLVEQMVRVLYGGGLWAQNGAKHRYEKTGKQWEGRGEGRKKERQVVQQVVHTARWVPGAWRGWLRYQTAHKREVGKTLAVCQKLGQRGNKSGGKRDKSIYSWWYSMFSCYMFKGLILAGGLCLFVPANIVVQRNRNYRIKRRNFTLLVSNNT